MLTYSVFSVLDLIESLVRNLNFKKQSSFSLSQDESVMNIQVLEDFSAVLSHLLEENVLTAWTDLSNMEFDFLRTRFIEIVQEVAIGVLESSNSESTF